MEVLESQTTTSFPSCRIPARNWLKLGIGRNLKFKVRILISTWEWTF